MLIQEQLQQLFISMFQLFLGLFNPVFLVPVIILIIILIWKNKEYKNSTYYQTTKQSYRSVKCDTGRYGEYLTYKYLKHLERDGAKFLFNIYLPKENGETTEIDVLMICAKGIFVFESKNYSGWIFGSETQRNWYQTLPKGRGRSHKEQFYNPIMQNRSHIKHLEALLDIQVPMWSVIVFSDRCTLKNVQIKSGDIRVINRCRVASVISDCCNQIPTDLLSQIDITNLYNKLYPYTQVDDATKAQHIANINSNLDPQSLQLTASMASPATQSESRQATEAEKSETESVQRSDDETQVLICPKCKGNLILRTATRGANAGNRFYGCSNYPKCKYTQSIAMESQMKQQEDSKSQEMTTHNMKLNPAPFAMIQSGQKTFELRLLDEKRQQIRVGDRIVFTNTQTGEIMEKTVVGLHRFESFAQLYRALPLLQCGYTAENVALAKPGDMEQYYTQEQQQQYGVVGIELK